MAKVLVVDDHQEIRQLLEDGLKFAGHQVATAEDGQKALDLIPKERPDIILLDIMMPHVDGNSFLRRLRSEPLKEPWIPVIVISALNKLEDIKKSLSLEADHYITKPWEMRDVLKGIEVLLNLRDKRK